jgi:hypothetical protein
MAAINTAAKARDEGNWRLELWSPTIASDTELDTWVGEMLLRANDYIRFRVGATWYTANVATDPIDDILKEAEMHQAQYLILMSVAGLVCTGSDTNAAPFGGNAKDILVVAGYRREAAEQLILATRLYGSGAKPLDKEGGRKS